MSRLQCIIALHVQAACLGCMSRLQCIIVLHVRAACLGCMSRLQCIIEFLLGSQQRLPYTVISVGYPTKIFLESLCKHLQRIDDQHYSRFCNFMHFNFEDPKKINSDNKSWKKERVQAANAWCTCQFGLEGKQRMFALPQWSQVSGTYLKDPSCRKRKAAAYWEVLLKIL